MHPIAILYEYSLCVMSGKQKWPHSWILIAGYDKIGLVVSLGH